MKDLTCVKYSRELAEAALKIQAIRLSPDSPFTWASGYRMPVYNDNRLLLAHPEFRDIVLRAMTFVVKQAELNCDFIAGIPTAGLPWGAMLADRMVKPFLYARKDAKDHGRRRQVEGVDDPAELKGKRILVVEDLISTGRSSMESIEVFRSFGAELPACISIFSYGFPEAADAFTAKQILPLSILDFPELMNIMEENRTFSAEQLTLLRSWNSDPFAWGEKHGFPKVER